MDEKALYKITYGLYVVSAQADGQRGGCVVNTLQQVTAEPIRLSVAVSKENFTCQLIQRAGRFAAVALDRRADLMDIGRFGFRTGREIDKFQDIPFAQDKAGMPYPTKTACAHYSCKVEQTLDLGTHILFVGLGGGGGDSLGGGGSHLSLLPQCDQGENAEKRPVLPERPVKCPVRPGLPPGLFLCLLIKGETPA